MSASKKLKLVLKQAVREVVREELEIAMGNLINEVKKPTKVVSKPIQEKVTSPSTNMRKLINKTPKPTNVKSRKVSFTTTFSSSKLQTGRQLLLMVGFFFTTHGSEEINKPCFF